MKRTISITLLMISFSFLLIAQTRNRVWRHFPASTYTAKLVGMSGTNTVGNTYTGTYDSDANSHYFDVVESGWYNMYFDVAGGTNWSLDLEWSPRYIPGTDARSFLFMEDSTLTLPELQRLMTYAAKTYLQGLSGDITNLPGDVSIKQAADSTLYVANVFEPVDTLAQSATPTIASGLFYRAVNDTLITITDFTNNPGVVTPKKFWVHVLTDSLVIQDGTIDCGGVDLAPDSLDRLEFTWDGLGLDCKFEKIAP